MVAAIFELVGWVGCERYFLEGETAAEVLTQLNWRQDLRCLARMGWVQELTPEGSAAIDHLWKVLDKQREGTLTVEDLSALDIELSIGTLKCLGAAEGTQAIARLKRKYEGLS